MFKFLQRFKKKTEPQPDPIDSIRILVFADLHTYDKELIDEGLDATYDMCVVLGDIPEEALRYIKERIGNRFLLGVVGNHDDWELLKRVGIQDMNGVTSGYYHTSIAGIGGSSLYKRSPNAMMSQEECMRLAEAMPPAHILISHDSPWHMFGTDDAHCGMQGIAKYLENDKVKLHICGHHHVTKNEGKTVCVYGCAVVHYPTGAYMPIHK